MDANEKILTLFTTRVRQLILQYDEKKKEIIAIEEKLKERESQIKELEAKLNQLQNDYTSLKMAKMIEISDGEMDEAQKRLSKLIRDVNKCITLLSEKQ
jgi:predicted  nucleic acid-binding Zn-ribbon protein